MIAAVETLGLVAGSGWGSGINLYLVTLLLGVAGRLGWEDIPSVLTRLDVLIAAGVLFLVEFAADKVPYVDNVWDTIHTFIRPLGAAALGAVVAGQSDSMGAALAAVVAGGLALNAHTAKATTRLAANASPEPVSNISLSLVEDFGVAGLMALAFAVPVVALIAVGVLVFGAGALTWSLWRAARRVWRTLGDKLDRWGLGAGR